MERSINIVITEENFDSGFRGEYKGYHIDKRLITTPNIISPICIKMNNYHSVPIINPLVLGLEIYDAIIYLNEKIELSYQIHKECLKTKLISNLYYVNIEKENIIHIIKRIIDDLIILLCIHYNYEETLTTQQVKIASIGDLKNIHNSELLKKIQTELNYDKYKIIFNVINDLHNSYKHSCLLQQSRSLVGADCVALQTYYSKKGNFENIKYLNHNLMHIIIAISDFLLEFFCNIKNNRNYKIITTKRNGTISY